LLIHFLNEFKENFEIDDIKSFMYDYWKKKEKKVKDSDGDDPIRMKKIYRKEFSIANPNYDIKNSKKLNVHDSLIEKLSKTTNQVN
jgi:hypothetical protein